MRSGWQFRALVKPTPKKFRVVFNGGPQSNAVLHRGRSRSLRRPEQRDRRANHSAPACAAAGESKGRSVNIRLRRRWLLRGMHATAEMSGLIHGNKTMPPEDTNRIIAAIDRNTRVRHWQPDGRYPGYETRINEHGYRETRQMKIPDGVPSGYERQMVQVWKGPKDIVIIGTPDESEDEETGHNCDAMGCGWDHVLWRITLTLAFCCILPAAPLMPPLDQPIIVEIGTPPLPPPNPHVQYWYTQWVPMDGGVYPQEVYAPALPKVEPMLYVFTDIGDPPRLVETPEPGTWWLALAAMVLMVAYLFRQVMPLRAWYLLWHVRRKLLKLRKALKETK